MSVHVGAYKFLCLAPSLFSTCSLHVQRICLQLSRLFARTRRQNTFPNVLDCTRAGRSYHNAGAVALLVVPPVHRDPRTRARIVPASESDASPPAVEQTQGPKRPPPLSLSILHPLAASAALPAPPDDRAVVKFPPASLHTWSIVSSCLSAYSSRAAGRMSCRRTGWNAPQPHWAEPHWPEPHWATCCARSGAAVFTNCAGGSALSKFRSPCCGRSPNIAPDVVRITLRVHRQP
jgi:hypothetical protein